MDKKNFIKDFQNLVKKLEKIDQELDKKTLDWHVVGKHFKKTAIIHQKLLECSSRIEETLQSSDQEFKTNYQKLKKISLANIDKLSEKIKIWIEKQRGRISKSTDVIKNIKRYNPNQKTSYYIDKNK